MKKLALILALVCFVIALGAQEFKPTVSVSGDATATLGFNGDTQIFALKNSFSADMTINLVPQATTNKAGEQFYGWIELKEFKLEKGDVLTGGTVATTTVPGTTAGTFTSTSTFTGTTAKGFVITVPTINAKVVYGPFYAQFQDSSTTAQQVTVGDYSIPNISDGKFLSTFGSGVKVQSAKASYAYLGYGSDPFDVTVKVVNNNDYCAQNYTQTIDWFVNPAVSLKMIPNLTLKAGVAFSTIKSVGFGVGASADYSLALTDKISLEVPALGVDLAFPDGADMTWAVGGGAYLKWGGVDEYKAYKSLAADCFNTYKLTDDSKVKYQSGLGFGVQYTSAQKVNLLVQANEQRGDDGLLKSFGGATALEIIDVANDTRAIKAGGELEFIPVSNITAWGRAVYNAKEDVTAGVGVQFAKVIPNTSVQFEWNDLNAASGNTAGLFTAGVTVAF